MRSSRTIKRAPKKPEPELSESWGVFDDDEAKTKSPGGPDDDEISDYSGASTDEDKDGEIEDYEDVEPAVSSISTSRPDRSARVTRSPMDREARASRPETRRRRSTRLNSRTNSVEPELIMPSLQAMDTSFARQTPPTSVRSRKVKSPLRTTQTVGKPSPKRTRKSVDDYEGPENSFFLGNIWSQFIYPVLGYLLGILGHAMVHLKPIFGALLAFFFLVQLGRLAFQFPFPLNPLRALNILPSPCSIPVISTLIPFCGSSIPTLSGPVEFEKLVDVQAQFEDILDSATQGYMLPLDMKRSEAAVRDLKHVVQYSHLPSKEGLLFEFTSFIELARHTSTDLTKFNSRIGRAVDQIISINRHTLQVIDGFKETDASRGSLSRLLFGSTALTDQHLLDQYLKHTSQVEEQIFILIEEAQALLMILDKLDGHLDAIQGVVTRDGINVQNDKDQLLSDLWGKLGGHRDKLAKKDEQLRLLNSVNIYRRQAWAHVTATIVKLQAIFSGLEDLRERVALPEVVGVHEVPLQQHIWTIQMGVERLEQTRKSAREIEGTKLRSIVDKGNGRAVGSERMVDGKIG